MDSVCGLVISATSSTTNYLCPASGQLNNMAFPSPWLDVCAKNIEAFSHRNAIQLCPTRVTESASDLRYQLQETYGNQTSRK